MQAVTVAVLLERAAGFRKGSTFLNEPALEEWLVQAFDRGQPADVNRG
jgi:hypothetical protein